MQNRKLNLFTCTLVASLAFSWMSAAQSFASGKQVLVAGQKMTFADGSAIVSCVDTPVRNLRGLPPCEMRTFGTNYLLVRLLTSGRSVVEETVYQSTSLDNVRLLATSFCSNDPTQQPAPAAQGYSDSPSYDTGGTHYRKKSAQ